MFLQISQNSQENICAKDSFLIKLQASGCNFIKKDSLTQVFSYEFCEIFKNTFSTEHLQTAASEEAFFAWLSIGYLFSVLQVSYGGPYHDNITNNEHVQHEDQISKTVKI